MFRTNLNALNGVRQAVLAAGTLTGMSPRPTGPDSKRRKLPSSSSDVLDSLRLDSQTHDEAVEPFTVPIVSEGATTLYSGIGDELPSDYLANLAKSWASMDADWDRLQREMLPPDLPMIGLSVKPLSFVPMARGSSPSAGVRSSTDSSAMDTPGPTPSRNSSSSFLSNIVSVIMERTVGRLSLVAPTQPSPPTSGGSARQTPPPSNSYTTEQWRRVERYPELVAHAWARKAVMKRKVVNTYIQGGCQPHANPSFRSPRKRCPSPLSKETLLDTRPLKSAFFSIPSSSSLSFGKRKSRRPSTRPSYYQDALILSFTDMLMDAKLLDLALGHGLPVAAELWQEMVDAELKATIGPTLPEDDWDDQWVDDFEFTLAQYDDVRR